MLVCHRGASAARLLLLRAAWAEALLLPAALQPRLCCCQACGVLPQATPQLTTQASLGFWMSHETLRRLSNPFRRRRSATTVHWMGPSFNYASPPRAPGCCGRNSRRHLGPCRQLPWHRVAQRAAPGRCWARRAREKRPRTLGRRRRAKLRHVKYENEFTIQHVRASDERPLFHARAVAGACSRFPRLARVTIGELQRWWIKGPPPPTVVHVHCPPLEVVNDVGQLLTLAILRLLEMVSGDPIVRLNSFGPRCLGPGAAECTGDRSGPIIVAVGCVD